jgi:hypothetical protein
MDRLVSCLWPFLSVVAIAACQSYSLAIGSNERRGGDDLDAAPAPDSSPPPPDADGDSAVSVPPGTPPNAGPGSTLGNPAMAPQAGAGASLRSGEVSYWTGYIENYMLPAGTDEIAMTLRLGASGLVTGMVLFGGLPLLPSPTDPNLGWPPSFHPKAPFPYEQPDWMDHFAFTIRDGLMTGSTLQFSLVDNEFFAQWCTLQSQTFPLHAIDPCELPGYSCAPESYLSPYTGCIGVEGSPSGPYTPQPVPIDCAKAWLCVESGSSLCSQDLRGPCSCTQAGCAPEWEHSGVIVFKLIVTGSQLDGTAVGLGGDARVIRNVYLVTNSR